MRSLRVCDVLVVPSPNFLPPSCQSHHLIRILLLVGSSRLSPRASKYFLGLVRCLWSHHPDSALAWCGTGVSHPEGLVYFCYLQPSGISQGIAATIAGKELPFILLVFHPNPASSMIPYVRLFSVRSWGGSPWRSATIFYFDRGSSRPPLFPTFLKMGENKIVVIVETDY